MCRGSCGLYLISLKCNEKEIQTVESCYGLRTCVISVLFGSQKGTSVSICYHDVCMHVCREGEFEIDEEFQLHLVEFGIWLL